MPKPIATPADLDALDGFAYVAGESLLAVCDDLVAADPAAARFGDLLVDAAAVMQQVAPRATPDAKRRALRVMTLHYLVRLWRSRPPTLPPAIAAGLGAATGRLAEHLGALIARRRPPPLDVPRLADVRVGVFRRRLDHFAPLLARQLSGPMALTDHGTRFEDWLGAAPSDLPSQLDPRGRPFGDPSVREAVEHLLDEVRAAERDSVAPRQERAARVRAAASGNDVLQAAIELVATQSTAAEPVEALRRQATVDYDDVHNALEVRCHHYLACLESSTCSLVTVRLDEPLAPSVTCGQRDTPCTLKRLAAELLAEALAGAASDVPVQRLDALRAHCQASPSQRMVARLDEVGQWLEATAPEEGLLAWVLTPFERLDLARLTDKKKGGWKSKRLSRADADAALDKPAHVIAASILKGFHMFQDRRHGLDPMDALGPALAALAGDDAVYVSFDGELVPLRVSVGAPRLEARLDDEGRARFVVTMEGAALERPLAPGRSWVTRLDLRDARLAVGHVTAAMRNAASALIGAPPTRIDDEDKERFAETLLAISRRAPVAPSEAWLGDKVAPTLAWVLQLVWSGPTKKAADGSGGRALEARLRVRVVPELGALTPGDGERILPLKRLVDGAPHVAHVQRDLDAEVQAGIAAAEALGLGWPGTAALFDWRFVALEEAVALVTAAQERAREGRLELVWDSRPLQVTRGAKAERLQIKVGFRRDWLDIKGGFLLDGAELPLKELLQALRDNKRFVAVDDERFLELDDDLRRSLAPLASLAREVSGKVVASPLGAALIDELAEAGADVDTPAEWLGFTERMHEAASLEPAIPDGLVAELRPYQVDGYRWMARLAHWAPGACLADDMGLGKTLQALTLVLSRAHLGPTLVVAPTSVVANWTREAARFAPTLTVRRALQGAAIDEAIATLAAGHVLVTTWDLFARNERLATFQADRPWATVVLDEAHAVKNASTRRAQAARGLEAAFTLALTGTPVENRPLELWSLFSVVAPGLLGSLESFREGFGRDIEARTPEASRRLSRLIRPFMLRRTKGEVAPDLPPRTEVRVDVVLSGDERERYQRVRMAAIKELDALGPEALEGQKGMMRVLAVLTRLRQLACHPRLVEPKAPATSAKLERLLELADELRGEGRKMLVFSQFTELLALVKKAFDHAGLSYAYLDGSTPGEERVRAVDRFQSGAVDAFLLSLKAGGVGLNLTTATEVIHLDPWWNPAVEDQASDRAHRIGQDKPVTIYRLVATSTIEEQILALHGDKREMVSGLLAGTDSARALSTEDLTALLTGDDRDDESARPG